MNISRISRLIVALAGLFFAGAALALWMTPETAAHRLGIEIVRATAVPVVRADLGGLFAAMAVLSLAAAWTRRPSWIYPAVAVVTAVVIGRCLGWIANRGIGRDVIEFAVELGVIAALLCTLPGSLQPRVPEPRRIRRSSLIAMVIVMVPAALGAAALMNEGLEQRIFERAAQQRAAVVNRAPLEDDALRVAICGSSAPLPSEERGKACVAIFAGGKFYVIDAGPESVENLVLWAFHCRRSARYFSPTFTRITSAISVSSICRRGPPVDRFRSPSMGGPASTASSRVSTMPIVSTRATGRHTIPNASCRNRRGRWCRRRSSSLAQRRPQRIVPLRCSTMGGSGSALSKWITRPLRLLTPTGSTTRDDRRWSPAI